MTSGLAVAQKRALAAPAVSDPPHLGNSRFLQDEAHNPGSTDFSNRRIAQRQYRAGLPFRVHSDARPRSKLDVPRYDRLPQQDDSLARGAREGGQHRSHLVPA